MNRHLPLYTAIAGAVGQVVLIGLVNPLFTVIAMLLIDRIGRKKMLLIGSTGMSLFPMLFAKAYLSRHFEGHYHSHPKPVCKV